MGCCPLLSLEKLRCNNHFPAIQHAKSKVRTIMAKTKIFIEPRSAGGFGAKHEGGRRAVITAETQGQVIDQAKGKYPDAEIHVARVRNIGSGPDKFRKI